MQANDYFMHLDVKKYFPSINHHTLKVIVKKHIHQQDVLQLFFTIINSTAAANTKEMPDLFTEDLKGLPIGNLTSQFLANLYLNELDQYIKHELKLKY
ncbi:MAG: RNA-directed DNA polymerase [Ferruginibacter sp.]